MVLAELLGTKDLIAILFVGFIVLVVLFMGRRINLNVGKVSATIAAAAGNAEHAAKLAAVKAEELKQTVGEKNGSGDLMTVVAEIRAKQEDIERKVDERTHVLRSGRTEPEELAVYTQDRMHDILSILTVVKLMLDTMWTAMKDDYNLPDLPSITVPLIGESHD